MSFPVAVQSAVFYIVACTPCAKIRHRKKTRDQAKKDREVKANLEVDQPGLYRHPSPFNTNPYWQDEIDMGPKLPKKSASKNSSQRGLTSAGRESEARSFSEHTNVGESRTNFGDSTSVVDGISEDWNRRPGYQREDEELWGQWSGSGQRLMDAFSKARDSAGRLIESTLGIDKEVTEKERQEFYHYSTPKNPPINDYHPPVVSSKLPSKDAHRWMLQPPPPAKIMEGKIPVSRAGSSGSKSSGRTLVGEEVQLGRFVQEKLVMEKIRRETANPDPTESELIDILFATRSNRSGSLTRSRSLSFDTSDDSLDYSFDRRTRTRLRPVARPSIAESDLSDDDEPIPPPSNTNSVERRNTPHAAQRPQLETIQSTRSLKSSNGSGNKGICGRTSNSTRASPSKPLTKRRKSTRPKRLSGAGSPVGDDTD